MEIFKQYQAYIYSFEQIRFFVEVAEINFHESI